MKNVFILLITLLSIQTVSADSGQDYYTVYALDDLRSEEIMLDTPSYAYHHLNGIITLNVRKDQEYEVVEDLGTTCHDYKHFFDMCDSIKRIKFKSDSFPLVYDSFFIVESHEKEKF